MSTTLGTIIDQIRERTDLMNSEFVTDAEITEYINYSLGELYGLLVNSYGGTYFATSSDLAITAGSELSTADFPVDMYKLLGVDLYLGGVPSQNRLTLQPFNFNERNRANNLNVAGYANQAATNYRYHVLGSKLMVQPAAAAPLLFKLWYVPQAPEFIITPADPTQTFGNNATLNGWLEYIIVDVSIKLKTKEETDTSMFVRQKALLTERIRNESQNRDIGAPATVSDVYAVGTMTDSGIYGYGYGYGRWY